jgi:predicted O-methyltransferase YrrM
MIMSKRPSLLAVCALVGLAVIAGMVGFSPPLHRAMANKRAEEKLSLDAKAEARILGVLDGLYNEPNGMWNVTPEDGRLLRVLAETTGAKRIVEVGTCIGYSGIWFCLALRTTGGTLVTHEIDDYRASLARENFKRAGVDKIVTIVEGDAHKTVAKITEPIDILFLDADKTGYLDYLNKLLPLVRPGGLILAHNTTDRAAEMKDYIKAVTTNPDLETIFLHKEAPGLALTLKKRHADSSRH